MKLSQIHVIYQTLVLQDHLLVSKIVLKEITVYLICILLDDYRVLYLHMHVEENYPRLKTNVVWHGRPRVPKQGLNDLLIEQILKFMEL